MFILSGADAFFYLKARNILGVDAVTRGELQLISRSRRNISYLARSRWSPDVIIKQPRNWNDRNLAACETELAWYRCYQSGGVPE